MNTHLIPDDSTGSVIKRWAENGSNLEQAMLIDFFLLVPAKEVGQQLSLRQSLNDFKQSVEYDAESNTWTCYLSKEMLPDYGAIVAIEHLLEKVSQEINGSYEGFASYGNSPEQS